MSFADDLAQDRRLCLLRVLAQAPGYSANGSILHAAIRRFGHQVSRDQVRTDLAWLKEQGLVELEDLDSLAVATLTQRGLDAAAGRATVPGVKKPAPSAR